MALGSGQKASEEIGAFQVMLIDDTGGQNKHIAGVTIRKNKSGSTCDVLYYVGGKAYTYSNVRISYNNDCNDHKNEQWCCI